MGLDPYAIRDDFPIFKHRKVVYLDNAATSQRPKRVIEAVRAYYERFNANIHRGLHELSQEASRAYEEAHEVVAKFIGAESWDEVVFVRNATEALNMAAFSLGAKLVGRGDEIVVTIMEHHSNLLPWSALARLKGAKLKVVGLGEDFELDYRELEEAVTDRTKVVAVTHMSNVLGTINDVKRVAEVAHKVEALVVVDGAQSVPHIPVNVRELGADLLAFSGHKMLGPTGVGVLYARRELLEDMEPVIYGGGMIKEVHYSGGSVEAVWAEPPWKFEAGTPNIAGGIGLAEAARYLMEIGMEEVRRHEERLTEYAIRRMEEELGERVVLYGPRRLSRRGGIVSFNLGGYSPHLVASILDGYGIAVRSGFHCAQPLHEYLGASKGSVRASFYIYNVPEDVDALVDGLKKALNLLEAP